MFGDYYWFSDHHDRRSTVSTASGCAAPTSGTTTFSEASARLRLEMNSNGPPGRAPVPYVKDLRDVASTTTGTRRSWGSSPRSSSTPKGSGACVTSKTPAGLYRIDTSDFGRSADRSGERPPLRRSAATTRARSETDQYKIVSSGTLRGASPPAGRGAFLRPAAGGRTARRRTRVGARPSRRDRVLCERKSGKLTSEARSPIWSGGLGFQAEEECPRPRRRREGASWAARKWGCRAPMASTTWS